MKHNNVIPNGHFKKHWQNYVKTWFNQPARKARRRTGNHFVVFHSLFEWFLESIFVSSTISAPSYHQLFNCYFQHDKPKLLRFFPGQLLDPFALSSAVKHSSTTWKSELAGDFLLRSLRWASSSLFDWTDAIWFYSVANRIYVCCY